MSIEVHEENLTPYNVLKSYLPAGLITESLDYETTNFHILLSVFANLFRYFNDFCITLLENFMPINDNDDTFAEIWSTAIGLESNPEFPLNLSANPASKATKWQWLKYIFYKFQQIESITDINTCLADLGISITAYSWYDLTEQGRNVIQDIYGEQATPWNLVIFDITNYLNNSQEDFPYDLPIDFYNFQDLTILKKFLTELTPIYIAPLFEQDTNIFVETPLGFPYNFRVKLGADI